MTFFIGLKFAMKSSADSGALSGFRLSEAHLFKEFASHVAEPLKDTDTVNIQDEAVFLSWITFKFRLGMFGGKLLIMFSRKEFTGKFYRLLCEYPFGHLVWKAFH